MLGRGIKAGIAARRGWTPFRDHTRSLGRGGATFGTVLVALRIDSDKTEKVVRHLRTMGGVLVGAAALGTLIMVVGLAVLLIVVFGGHAGHTVGIQVAAGGCIFLAAVLVPGVAATSAVVAAVRSFRQAAALEVLRAQKLLDGTLDRQALELQLGRERAERTITRAVGSGALVTTTGAMGAPRAIDPSLSPRLAPTPTPALSGGASPPTPRVVVPEAAYSPRVAPASLGLAPTSLATPSIRPGVLAPEVPDGSAPSARTGGPGAGEPISIRPPPGPAAMPDTRSPGLVPMSPLAGPMSPVAAPARPQVPEVVALDLSGRTFKSTWVVERRLASGGMGAVYLAHHARTGRRYALKSLLPSAQLSEAAITRFEREARAATAIGHAGIAAVHDFDVTPEGLHYFVMDLLEGESLESRLARVGRLPWPDAKRVVLDVADALAAAHRAGVLHRDVKPSNVFMAQGPGGHERAMLVDFGLAKPIRPGHGESVTRTGAIVGTAHYMSPEQARSEPVDERTDVYGLGATLYEMIAGVPPFLGASPFAVMAMLLEEQAVAPSQLTPGTPPAVDALVLRAIAKAPDARFPNVPALRAAVQAA